MEVTFIAYVLLTIFFILVLPKKKSKSKDGDEFHRRRRPRVTRAFRNWGNDDEE